MKKGWKRFWAVLGVLALILLVLAVLGYREARSLGFLREPVFETVRGELPPMGHPAVLVFSKTSLQRGVVSRGYRPGPFAGDEDAVTQFVRLIAQTYRDGALPARVPFPTALPDHEELSR